MHQRQQAQAPAEEEGQGLLEQPLTPHLVSADSKPDFFCNVTKLKLSIVQRQECFLSAFAHRTSQDGHAQTKLLLSKSYLYYSCMHMCFSSMLQMF